MAVVDIVKEMALPIVESLGLVLWDVEFKKEGSEYYLRIFIDRVVPTSDGVSGILITDCEEVSRQMDVLLDEHDPVPQSYILEISSAGLLRELKNDIHYKQFLGYKVSVNLFKKILDIPKKFDGILMKYDDEFVLFDVNGKEYSIPKKDISKISVDLV